LKLWCIFRFLLLVVFVLSSLLLTVTFFAGPLPVVICLAACLPGILYRSFSIKIVNDYKRELKLQPGIIGPAEGDAEPEVLRIIIYGKRIVDASSIMRALK
jgi:hypothetical protein